MVTSMLRIKSLRKLKKKTKAMNNKTYNWCKWHKAWVENDPDKKGSNRFQLRKKLEE